MTMNNTGPGEALDNSEPTVLAEFKATREDLGVIRNSATHRQMRPHTGRNYNVINYNKLRAYRVNIGVPTAMAQELADDLTTFSPNEVSVKVQRSGAAQRRSGDSNLDAEIEEQEGAAQFSSLSSVVGAAGTACSPGHLNAMDARLGYGNSRSNPEAIPRPWNYIAHPIHKAIVAGRLTGYEAGTAGGGAAYDGTTNSGVRAAGRGQMTDDLIKRGVGALGMFNGHPFKTTPYIPVDSSDDASMALISEAGLYYINEVSYKVNSKPLERDGKEFLGWGAYCFGLYKLSTHGVEGLFDATELTG
jgi:hypothetical protein